MRRKLKSWINLIPVETLNQKHVHGGLDFKAQFVLTDPRDSVIVLIFLEKLLDSPLSFLWFDNDFEFSA